MLEIKDLIDAIMILLVPINLFVLDADIVDKRLYVVFNNLPINLKGQHQIRENVLGKSESLSRLEYLLKLLVFFLGLRELLSFLVTYGLEECELVLDVKFH